MCIQDRIILRCPTIRRNGLFFVLRRIFITHVKPGIASDAEEEIEIKCLSSESRWYKRDDIPI